MIVKIIENIIMEWTFGYLPIERANIIANEILNALESNGYEITKIKGRNSKDVSFL